MRLNRLSVIYFFLLNATPLAHILAAENLSDAVGVWKPTGTECEQALHDAFSVTDTQGVTHAAWHPEIDVSGCSYAHTHPYDSAIDTRYNNAIDAYFDGIVAAVEQFRGNPTGLIARTSELAAAYLEETRIFETARSATIAFHVVPAEPAIRNAMAFGIWKPTKPGECSQEQHDAYNVVIDGVRYPTWHPAVDPSGCFFGHEHGDNPRNYPNYDPVNHPIAFGYQNELAMMTGINHIMRGQDHNGQKVAAGTGIPFGYNGIPANITCDVLAVFHQGTHSKDAFTNNLHAQSHEMTCSNGWYMRVQLLTQVQKAGYFTAVGELANIIYAGEPAPANSPVASHPFSPGGSMGTRQIPTCEQILRSPSSLLRETWQTINTLSAPGNRRFVRFSDYWNVGNPSRCYDSTQLGLISRISDICWTPGVTTQYRINSGQCVTQRRKGDSVTWDSVESVFNGANRSMRPDSWTFKLDSSFDTDDDGILIWYTDALGLNPSLAPFPGSLQQEATAISIPQEQYGLRNSNMAIRVSGDMTGVHSPN